MQYQVLVQSQSDDTFQASVVGVPNCTAQAVTREAAIGLAKNALQQQLNQGELVTIHLDSDANHPTVDPWVKNMGIFVDDPTFDDFLSEVAAYRQQIDIQANE
jgi:predicted RNase H-like HicB family nuclease